MKEEKDYIPPALIADLLCTDEELERVDRLMARNAEAGWQRLRDEYAGVAAWEVFRRRMTLLLYLNAMMSRRRAGMRGSQEEWNQMPSEEKAAIIQACGGAEAAEQAVRDREARFPLFVMRAGEPALSPTGLLWTGDVEQRNEELWVSLKIGTTEWQAKGLQSPALRYKGFLQLVQGETLLHEFDYLRPFEEGAWVHLEGHLTIPETALAEINRVTLPETVEGMNREVKPMPAGSVRIVLR